MAELHVVIAFDPDSESRAERWCCEIPRAWPRSDHRPRCSVIPMPALLEQLRAGEDPERGGALLLLAEAAGPRAMLIQIIDRLLESRQPTLVLTEQPETLREEFEREGVVVEAFGCEPASVARALHALTARQPALETLSRDLRIARASQSGLSGEIGRLHDELELAGAVQRRFLPRTMPEVSGYEFGVFFRPVGYVSGDIYDIARIDDRRVAFMLADAVGHGVPAALLTLVIGRALRQVEHDADGNSSLASPAATLARLNVEMCIENEAGDRFATAVCGVIDEARGCVTLSSAGHPAPLIVDPAGCAHRVVGGDGPLLGVFPQITFTETTVELRPGQTLLLYSDGFETAFPPADADPTRAAASEDYVRHFAQAVTAQDAGPGRVQAGLERLAMDLDEQAGSFHQRDDLTAVALYRLPERRSDAGVLRAVA
ncbi:MAG: serine/threonine-protein phosphatase [Phycisphaerales bacterium]|nr:serine/threonine-protein phosphatase [Phycisphaerales bacterium]